jgi:hypothetical protein
MTPGYVIPPGEFSEKAGIKSINGSYLVTPEKL